MTPSSNMYWNGGTFEDTYNATHVNLRPEVQEAIVVDERDSEARINEVIDSIRDMLLEKNRKYGDSALNPSRIFSRSDAIEQIRVRIDDKLTRLKNMQGDEDEDVVLDLMGYLVLLRVATLKAEEEPSGDEAEFDIQEWIRTLEKQSPTITTPPWIAPNPQPWNPWVTWNTFDDGHTVLCSNS